MQEHLVEWILVTYKGTVKCFIACWIFNVTVKSIFYLLIKWTNYANILKSVCFCRFSLGYFSPRNLSIASSMEDIIETTGSIGSGSISLFRHRRRGSDNLSGVDGCFSSSPKLSVRGGMSVGKLFHCGVEHSFCLGQLRFQISHHFSSCED